MLDSEPRNLDEALQYEPYFHTDEKRVVYQSGDYIIRPHQNPWPQFLLSNLETLGLRSNILEEKWSAEFLACGFVLRVFVNYAV